MITGFANRIVQYFIARCWIDASEHEIYQYGCEVILSFLINVSIVFLCGMVTGQLPLALLFYVVFLLFRRYCGGYHAKTYLRCNLIFTANMLIALFLIGHFFDISSTFFVAATVFAVFIIILLSPIDNDSKPLNEDERKKYRVVSVVLAVLTGAGILFCDMQYRQIAFTMLMALLSVSVAMLYEILKREVLKYERNC